MPPRPTVLLTGAGGFCATALAARLAAEAGGPVVGLNLLPEPPHADGLSDYLVCDLTNRTAVGRAIRTVRPDWIFHLAGLSQGTRRSLFAANARATEHLLLAVASERPSAAVVIMGSAAEYGPVPRRRQPITEDQPCRPNTPYGASKYAATRAARRHCRAHGVRVVIARPFNIIGPLMPPGLLLGAVLHQVRDAMAAGQRPAVVRVGPTSAVRDFVAVEDVVTALIHMVQSRHWGEIFNLCSGTPTSIARLLDAVAAAVDWPVRFARRPGIRARGPAIAYGSYAKAERTFGFSPQRDVPAIVQRICRIELGGTQPRDH